MARVSRGGRSGWPRGVVAAVLAVAAGSLLTGTGASGGPQGDPGWEVRPPGEHGFDATLLDRAYARADSLSPLTGFLVARDTALVAEKYWRGLGPDAGVNIKSASKSIISALVGIALEEGHLSGLDQPVADFFPEFFSQDGIDPRKRRITLRHLLTMTAGLETTSFGNYGWWVTHDDWARTALEQPVVAPPGTRMVYSTGNSHLLSVILTKATGRSTRAFARRHLFRPLGIRVDGWQESPRGYYFGGNNLRLEPREMMRFGQLYLRGGRWRGRQVVPSRWVRDSWRTYTRSERFGFDFGYFWWNRTLTGHRVHYAWGYGGQFIFVVPDLDVVVVATSTSTPDRRGGVGHLESVYDIVARYVLPSAEAGRSGGRPAPGARRAVAPEPGRRPG